MPLTLLAEMGSVKDPSAGGAPSAKGPNASRTKPADAGQRVSDASGNRMRGWRQSGHRKFSTNSPEFDVASTSCATTGRSTTMSRL
jgi:hypothetical protein